VRLIAGGLLKETDLAWVKKTLFKNVRGIYIIGRCAEAMRAAWTDAAPCCVCEDLEKAVGRAWKEAEPGDVVLLSPGCASFDQFQGFEERGERFAQMVRGLKERGRS
jgi:UDP-N-acetylmuramoylalanine--D-glutamate ligase